jgi:Icc-related predicted phosphoesterase
MSGYLAQLKPIRRLGGERSVRIAATGDLHVRNAATPLLLSALARLHEQADLLLVVGDLTENGRLIEAEAAAEILSLPRVPAIAVLGNHDLRSLRRAAFRRTLERSGIEILDGRSTTVRLPSGVCIGVAGTTGSGGGFWPVEGPDAVHARTFKRLAVRAKHECLGLEQALAGLDADVLIAVTHFAPTASTLGREPLAKYWMLGNSELGQVIDRRRPDIAFHGHAHLGTLLGTTPGGVPVRNVALPVVGAIHLELLGRTCGRPIPLDAPALDSLAR